VPDTSLTGAEARQRLGLGDGDRVILFFGHIGPYKGLQFLVEAFQRLGRGQSYRLIIAGEPRGGCEPYWRGIRETIADDIAAGRVLAKIQHTPDAETETYFKAADVLVLPYTHISQSGVLFLSYRFGLPVIATDVGSLRDDVVEGETGFLCKPCDPADLSAALDRYFGSDLFESLAMRRGEIRDYASARHSWDMVGEMTRAVYARLLGSRRR
jgi:glycosyltransferase involved in cell wall biosynthesis